MLLLCPATQAGDELGAVIECDVEGGWACRSGDGFLCGGGRQCARMTQPCLCQGAGCLQDRVRDGADEGVDALEIADEIEVQ